MAYTEITVLVGGAVEQSETFNYDDIFEVVKLYGFIADTQKEAEDHPELIELYELWHDHDELGQDEECVCVQYLTDHKPFWTNGCSFCQHKHDKSNGFCNCGCTEIQNG